MQTTTIGILWLTNDEYVIGFAKLTYPKANVYGFFIGSLGIGIAVEWM